MIFDEESFVDLYEVLEISPRADAAALRQKISVLYIEARDNIDHRNHRKRFYYRELYEIHLPNARTVLLDLEKRAEYDRQLQEYRAQNKKFSAPKSAGKAQTATPAADDFSEFGDVETAAPMRPIAPTFRMEQKVVEQRRDVKRRELIKHEIIANGFKWGLAGGLAVLLAGVILILIFHALMPGGIGAATGNSTSLFFIISGALILAVAAFAARQTMRWARQRTVGYLSKLPYDELLRQCAR